MHGGQSIQMSDSTPVKMADSKISAARLNKLGLLFSYRHKASRGANVAAMSFSSGGSPLFCVCTCWVISTHLSQVVGGFWIGGSVYLKCLSCTSQKDKNLKSGVWRPSGGLARKLATMLAMLFTRQWTEQRSSTSYGLGKSFCGE